MFSKKATKIDKLFTIDLTLCSKYQIDGEDFVDFCGLLRKHEHYLPRLVNVFKERPPKEQVDGMYICNKNRFPIQSCVEFPMTHT